MGDLERFEIRFWGLYDIVIIAINMGYGAPEVRWEGEVQKAQHAGTELSRYGGRRNV